MKKFTLFLIASLFSALSFAALNPYAYGLKSDLSLDESTLTVNYSLNADATGVNIVILNGETVVKTIACDGKTKGSYTVEVPTTDFPKSTSLTWKVEVLGNSVATPTKQTTTFSFYLPYSMDVDVDTESDYFGRWYVIEATNGGKGKSGYHSTSVGRGLYAFDAALEPIKNNSGTYGFTGGMTLGANTTNAAGDYINLACVTTSGGRVFVGRYEPGLAPILEATDLHSNNYPLVLRSGGGRAIALDARGRGENLQLVMLDTDFNIKEYDLGTAEEWTTAATPSRTFNKTGLIIDRNDAAITYDNEGGLWVNQNSASKPTIAHLSTSGLDYDNITAGLSYILGAAKYNIRGAAINQEGTELAVPAAGRGKVTVFTISKDSEGKISLTQKYTITTGNNNTALSYDYAGNLYIANRSAETISFYAMPYDEEVTTPAPSKYAFELTEVVPEVYTVTVEKVGEGTIEGGGEYVTGSTAILTATPAAHYDFVNWTEDGEVVSTTEEYSFTVTKDIELTANFQEHAKYTITASAADNTMGYVTGGKEYYAGETVTLKAVANSTYYFVNWSDGVTDAIRTFTATADVTLTANFAKATPRAWAYDLKVVEDGGNYKFTFNATTAGTATLLFADIDGNELVAPHAVGTVAAGAKTVTLAKTTFEGVTKDVYWSVKMDGEAIPAISEITDQSRGIYDFYNMMGVVVDNDTESEDFGKIYIQQSFEYTSGTTADRNKTQKAGIFIYDQGLNELNNPANTGIQPQLPYTLGGDRQNFKRMTINPANGNIAFCNNKTENGGAYSVSRADLTSEAINLTKDIADIKNVNALCFDKDGNLYVVANVVTNYTNGDIYKIAGDGTYIKITPLRPDGKKIWVDEEIAIVSDGRGGIWVAQKRDGITQYSALFHVNFKQSKVDFVLEENQAYSDWFIGTNRRGAIAYDVQRDILAVHGPNVASLFSVAYDGEGVPTITKLLQTPNIGSSNIDGLAFDYAGDLYLVSSGTEKFYKYTLPTADNICTVPAPKSQAIIKEIRYNVTVNTVGNGTVTGAGEYVVGETATLEASPAAHHKFVNWTYGSETSTNNPLELVVDGDITVTANFEPVQYTLIAPTNDEDKGTVTGAGTYDYGTNVEITATPKEGYKLLYWSDRSTENPRTITMTKNEAISAYFVKEYDEEPTFKIEKIWENTNVPASTSNGYQAVGWDGKIYMQNRTAGKIITYSSAEDTGTDYATSGSGQQIAVDEAGNLIVFNATFSTANPNAILIYQKGSTEGKAVSFTLKDPARCDFFSASGDIYSPEGGYVYFYCAGKTVINRLKITNGAATTFDVTTDVVGEAVYSSPQNTNYVMVDIFGNLVAHARSNAINAINVYTNESKAFTLPSIKMGTLGGCSFELGGKELWAYHAGASNYSSEWNIYNMTDSKFLSDDDFYAVDKSATTNYACNWLNVQVVDEYTAYIYQFCPKKAVALWKVTLERDDLQEFTVTATANDPAMGTVTGGDTYYKDATATLTATPYAGYRFVNWTKAGVEVSTNATYTFTVTEDVELVANFEALPTITYELNGGVWNKYGWTSKKDMYDAFIADWKAYSGSTRATKTYEEQYGIGKSNGGIPTTIQGTEDVLGFMSQEKWAWLGQFLDALATAQGKATKPTEAVLQMRFGLGNFFGEDNNGAGASSWIGAVDCSGDIASITAFAPYWGQTFPMPTQPTEEIVLNAPYKEGCEFGGWYANSDFSGAAVTTVDENTDGTLYAKWIETIITVTIDENADNTAALEDYDGEVVTATVKRNFGPNKYLTLTLPFDMNATQIRNVFGNATVYALYNVVEYNAEEVYLQFSPVSTITAGTPYILATATSGYDAEDGFTMEGVEIDLSLKPVTSGTVTMVPVLDGGGTLNQPTQYYLYDNALYCAGVYNQSLPGLRAFFTSASSTPIRARVIFDDNGATSIPTVIAPKTKAQKIIKDGRLIIIRGEHQYNAQGQMIE